MAHPPLTSARIVPKNMRESEIILHLSAANDQIADETLEEHMFEVLQAVEDHASDIALGAVTAVDFDNHAIELAFSLCHDTQSEAQRKIADVLSVVEQNTPIKFGAADTHVRAQDRADESLALAH